MPLTTPCPKCVKVGQVRVEYVIHAGKSYRAFECHACGYQWRVLETGEHAASDERPDRSRSVGASAPAMNTDRRQRPSDRRKTTRT